MKQSNFILPPPPHIKRKWDDLSECGERVSNRLTNVELVAIALIVIMCLLVR
jgi:hypothetical protein